MFCFYTEGPGPLKRSPESMHDLYRKLRYRKLRYRKLCYRKLSTTKELGLFTSKGGNFGMR